MNWNRQEATLNECVNYVFWCSDISTVHAPRQWQMSELFATERKGVRIETELRD